MFGDKSLKLVDSSPNTLLDQGAQFEGKLTFDGTVQINGKFIGEIFSDGTLIIGESGEVQGKIDINTVIIHGKVLGAIQAKGRIEMYPPAWVQGDIISPALIVQEGAIFQGNCSMGKKVEKEKPVLESLAFNVEE